LRMGEVPRMELLADIDYGFLPFRVFEEDSTKGGAASW